ncbi:WD40-repeat-containing domain protein [Chytridium lagenaria]|nr:WD40-repeat-containing domain protein [Chytridium lagenaria]
MISSLAWTPIKFSMTDDEYQRIQENIAQHVALFGNLKGLTHYGSNAEDPNIVEMEEMMIAASDNLILAAKTEDDVSHIEVYLYEEAEDNLFVHHDIMLPSFPLCIEWLDFHVGRKAGTEGTGNYVAVGTFDPEIEIWDLDLVDAPYPEVILGGGPPGEALGKGKKKRKAKKPTADHHVDAVMCLSWNKNHNSILASGSADTTIKIWDLNSPAKALRSFNTHKSKVQALQWNPSEPTVLLSGGYDKRACVFDSRAPDKVASFALTADVEAIKWDPFHPKDFWNPSQPPIFTIHAHDSAVSALDVSSKVEGLIATGSTDSIVKVWSTRNNNLRCLTTRNVGVGRVFATNFSPDSDYALATAGDNGKVVVWNLKRNEAVKEAFGGGADDDVVVGEDGVPVPKKEFTTVEELEEEEEDEELELVGDDVEMDEDDEDEIEE